METLKGLWENKPFRYALLAVVVIGVYIAIRRNSAPQQQATSTGGGDAVGNFANNLQGLQQQNAVLAQGLGAVGYRLEQDIIALGDALTARSDNPAPNDMFYYQLGIKSTAGCYNPKTGDVNIDCFNINRTLDGANAPGKTTDGNAAATYIKNTFGTFINTSTNKIDFVSIGKYLYSQGNGLSNVGATTSTTGVTR